LTGSVTLLLVVLLALPLVAAAAPAGYRVAGARAPRERLLADDQAAWAPARTVPWGPAPYETRFRALWDAQGLFLRFDVDDPAPWHTMTKRDEHLWEEEVVEIFLDLDRSGRDYAELEISPANVVCDVRMLQGGPSMKGDLAWDIEGLETRVIRRTKDEKTEGWVALAFIPWNAFRSLPSSRKIALPPKPGDAWRFNLFRIKRPGGPQAPEKDALLLAWSKVPARSFHVPEVFRDLVFEP
jgi:hypothetical protein